MKGEPTMKNLIHRIPTLRRLATVLTLVTLVAATVPAQARYGKQETLSNDGSLPGPLREVGFEQKLGETIPLDLVFTDEKGEQVEIGSFFQPERPVVLALVYYECPMLCNLILNGLIGSLDILTFDPGTDYDVVVISFDPGEDHFLAAAKKRGYMEQFGRPGTETGFHFLTGEQESIDAIADAIGFTYTYDEESDEYAHAAGITVLTPEGTISRYLFGAEYAPKDLRLALVDSGDSKIGSAVDQLLLFCYSYDPATGKYGAATMRLVRLGGALTLLAVLAFIVISRRRDQRMARVANREVTQS